MSFDYIRIHRYINSSIELHTVDTKTNFHDTITRNNMHVFATSEYHEGANIERVRMKEKYRKKK